MRCIYRVVICWLVCVSSLPTSAANIHKTSPASSSIHIDGAIQSGDAERFAVLASQAYYGLVVSNVEIDSLGGDLNEALRLASLIDGMKLRLTVKKGGLCVSACFFLYVAAYDRTAWYVRDDGVLPHEQERKAKHPAQIYGYVGVHRPYFATSEISSSSSVVKQEDLMSKVRKYLAEKGVPQSLIDTMMSRPSNDVYWLKEKDLDMLGNYSPGVEEVMIQRCGYRRTATTVGMESEKLITYLNQTSSCISEVENSEFEPARKSYAAKMKSGWRPWKAR